MGSPYAGLFPPGTDLCQVPSGQPPPGHLPDFDAVGLKPLIISLSVIFTTIATIFGLGRLFVNLRKLQWSDRRFFSTLITLGKCTVISLLTSTLFLVFVLFVILLNIGYTVVLIVRKSYPAGTS